MTKTRDAQRPWMTFTLRAAAIYNVAWGLWAIFFPTMMFDLMGVEAPRYPQLWQVVGMIVGVYGVGYWVAANDPIRHWPIVLVGMLGKLFGPLGYVSGLVSVWLGLPYPGAGAGEQLPAGFGYTIITNDLIWWVPFMLMLWTALSWHMDPANKSEIVRTELADAKSSRGTTLGELSAERDLLVVFLRHGGCTFCKEAIADLRDVKPKLDNAGVGLAVVHLDAHDEGMASALTDAGLGDVPRVADPTTSLYRSVGFGRGSFTQLFGIAQFVRGAQATLRGHLVGGPKGDGFQLPGSVVMRNGSVISTVPAKSASDRQDYAGIACGIDKRAAT